MGIMTTISDVARRASVTPATVSNVISGKVRVCEATRDRVLAAIAELDYRPNLVARGLARGRSDVLALLLPDIANPYHAELAREVENIAHAHGYCLLVRATAYDDGAGRAYLRDLADRQVDGLLVMGGGLAGADVRDGIVQGTEQGPAIVLCNWEEDVTRLAAEESPPTVGLDFAYGAALAARHLLRLGHHRIAAIVHGDAPDRVVHTARLRGFSTALAGVGVRLTDGDVCYGASSAESGYVAATALLTQRERPTAIFATNDLMALGALAAAYDQGVRVPDELAVIGFDNIAMGAYVRPALTTVGAPTRDLAIEAVEMLLRGVDGQEQRERHLSVRPSLIVRGSTTAPGRAPSWAARPGDVLL